jgi:putative Mg2+ transporter-C (MgtC) family protein
LDALLSVPSAAEITEVALRLLTAALLGGLLGAEREAVGKAAGLRTHMLVALGSALFVIAPREFGLAEGDLGRIVQGIAAGIGFLGAGTILKLTERQEIKGLTTAANIWLTAAIGIASALSAIWVPILSAACAWSILHGLGKLEARLGSSERA